MIKTVKVPKTQPSSMKTRIDFRHSIKIFLAPSRWANAKPGRKKKIGVQFIGPCFFIDLGQGKEMFYLEGASVANTDRWEIFKGCFPTAPSVGV